MNFDLIQKLAETGIAYLLLAISFVVIGIMFRIIMDLQDKRLEDSKKTTDYVTRVLDEVKKSVDQSKNSIDLVLRLLENHLVSKK